MTRLWGTPVHLANVAKALREKHSEETLNILVAKRNSGSFTYDGIETGGERLCQEIEEELESLAKQGQLIKKISIVGYSLGGLVARYAIGLLDSRGVFDKVEPLVRRACFSSMGKMLTARRPLPPLLALILESELHCANGTITCGMFLGREHFQCPAGNSSQSTIFVQQADLYLLFWPTRTQYSSGAWRSSSGEPYTPT